MTAPKRKPVKDKDVDKVLNKMRKYLTAQVVCRSLPLGHKECWWDSPDDEKSWDGHDDGDGQTFVTIHSHQDNLESNTISIRASHDSSLVIGAWGIDAILYSDPAVSKKTEIITISDIDEEDFASDDE